MVLTQLIEFLVDCALPAIVIRKAFFFVEEESMGDAAGNLFAELVFGGFGVSVGFVHVGETGMGSRLVGDPCEVVVSMEVMLVDVCQNQVGSL